jgi:predicted transcriptional regulator
MTIQKEYKTRKRTRPLTVELPEEYREKLDQRATLEDRSKSGIIRRALYYYFLRDNQEGAA